jgi:hypothetical protein
MREVRNDEPLIKAEFLYFPYGPGAFLHNYLCGVCFKESAVLKTGPFPSTLQPCWICQGEGWRLERKHPKFRKFLDWIFE